MVCSEKVRQLGPLFPQKWLLGTTRANLQQDLLKVRQSCSFFIDFLFSLASEHSFRYP